MQTALEKNAIDIRHGVPVRGDVTTSNILNNTYNASDEYSALHKDALADGDVRGRGTGHGGHTHTIPDYTKPKNMFDYSNIDTSNKAGDAYDQHGRNGIGGREFLTAINIYNEENQYSANIIDTSKNVADGQVKI